MEHLDATLEGGKKTSMKDYLVLITVDVPYPKQFEYRESAGSIAPAVSRALKKVRKDLGRKRIKEFRIKAIQM